MQGGDIDTYIATFKKLLKLVGYQESEHGALAAFKKGLPNALNISIIRNTPSIPKNLEDYIKAAREQQEKYIRTQEFTSKGLSPKAKELARRLGINPNRQQRQRDPNAMDVDAGNMTDNRPRFTPLSDDEKEDLKARGACFRCKKQGNISKYCPLKRNRTADVGRPAPTPQARATATEPAEEPKKGASELAAQVKELMKDQTWKETFFDEIVESGFV